MAVGVGCGEKKVNSANIINDTSMVVTKSWVEALPVENKIDYDSIAKATARQRAALRPAKTTFEIGDTVIVDVTEYGASVGIIRAFKDHNQWAYVDFFVCNCNRWYSIQYNNFQPYSQTWNLLQK